MKGAVADISSNPKAVALGLNDMETFHWLWEKKYVKKPFDPTVIRIEDGDIRLFEVGVKEWQKGLLKKEGWFGTQFKLPKVLARGVQGAEEMVRNLGESVSYNQRQLKEGASHVNEMMQGLYKSFNDPESPIIKKFETEWTNAEYKKFQGLEKVLLNAKPEQREAAVNQVLDYIGSGLRNDKNPMGGQILRRYQKVLTMGIPTNEMTANEKNILKHWNILRVDSMKNLLNGAISVRRTIETLQDGNEKKNLMAAMDVINGHIDALLVSSDKSNKVLTAEYKERGGIYIPADKNAFMVYDPLTKISTPYVTRDSKTGAEVIGIANEKYFPKYVIELTDIMHNLAAYAKAPADKNDWKGKTPEQIRALIETELNISAVSNRLKAAGETEAYFSLDPLYYLNKYIHDVASFNLRARVNHAYSRATIPLIETIRKNNTDRGNAEVGEYAAYLKDMLGEIKDSALVNNGSSTTVMDEAVRMINAFEYISKLGFSVKGGLKNRTQGLYNWIMFGTRGYKISRDFKNTSSRPTTAEKDLTNEGMTKRQLKRFGMLIGEKAQAANISAATAGSLDVSLIPKGFDVNERGQLMHADKESTAKRLANAAAWAADKTSGPMRWAENKNRINTFEMAFAHSFMAERRREDYHRKKLIESGVETPTDKQVYDRIENMAGNEAFEMVKFLHYDYDNWAKARILQGKAGKVIGQYQHFKFAFFDMQYSILKDFTRSMKAFKFTEKDPLDPNRTIVNRDVSRVMRMVSLYSFIPGLIALATDYDVGGVMSTFGIALFEEDKKGKGDKSTSSTLIENPVVEEIAKLLEFVGNSPDGDINEQLKHYNAYYGKNPITANLGPFISDILTAAELTDFLNLTGAEYEEARSLNFDPDNPDWWYNVSRIFSIQGSRTIWKSLPAVLKGQWEKAFRIETGMYKPKWITKWRAKQVKKLTESAFTGNVLPKVEFKRPRVTKAEKASEKELLRRRALDVINTQFTPM